MKKNLLTLTICLLLAALAGCDKFPYGKLPPVEIPTESPTVTQAQTQTAALMPTATPVELETPTPALTHTTVTPKATVTLQTTESPDPTATPTPTVKPSVSVSPKATLKPTPKPTAKPTAKPTMKPTATHKPAPTPTPAPSSTITPMSSSYKNAVLKGVNYVRTKNGSDEIPHLDSSLSAKAQKHAEEMAAKGDIFHSGLGYAESVAMGTLTLKNGEGAGAASAAHAAGLIAPDITRIGVGAAKDSDGTIYLCVMGGK